MGTPGRPRSLLARMLTVQRYTVVEEGEDGIIVQDAKGHRRLVTIPPEARGERLEVGGKQTR